MDQLATATPYRVLARKYRPTRLSELIGQEALVCTLQNALASGRVAHAFLLSGIRGVGKTTTARIIARALNCTGPDGTGEPTPEPCGVCSSCRAIAEERPLDVIEMDAATRTGIDDIREIVDSVRYAPASSRYKVYIIDEVHMLSEKAFNGLLKTLEEPPPHAKFIFATTEVRKVPVTVLSRCQRFDLRRVETPVLQAHLASICEREAVGAEVAALQLIAGAAEGSVRDSLSLLDQAIALSNGPVESATVQDMLGLGDRRRLVDLLGAVLGGDTRSVLTLFAELYALGAEPAAVLADILAFTHELSRMAAGATGGTATGVPLGPEIEVKLAELAGKRSLPVLARAWQILLKGIDEVRLAPDAVAAAEMVLLRAACVAEVPPPGELARLLRGELPAASAPPLPRPASAPLKAEQRPSPPAHARAPEPPAPATPKASPSTAKLPEAKVEQLPAPIPSIPQAGPADFAALLDCLREAGERPLAAFLEQGAHLIRYEVGRIEFRAGSGVPPDAAGRLREAASRITGRPWAVALGQAQGEPTLAEQRATLRTSRIAELEDDPAVKRVLDVFPGARLVDVRPARPAAEPLPSPEPLPDQPRPTERP